MIHTHVLCIWVQIVSNGRYKAVLHRALVHGGQTRMSFVSLVGPCLDAVVEPVLELAQNDPQGMKFRGIRYRAYMEHPQRSKLNTKAALALFRVEGDILTCESTTNNSTEADSSGYSPTS